VQICILLKRQIRFNDERYVEYRARSQLPSVINNFQSYSYFSIITIIYYFNNETQYIFKTLCEKFKIIHISNR